MWGKHCGRHHHCDHLHCDKRKKRIRYIFAGLFIFLLTVLIIVLIIWAILHPKNPRFIIQDATVNAFDVSTPNTLTVNIQVTIYSRNPNDNIAIYYDRVEVYAKYRSQQITPRTRIPLTYQGHNEVDVWSPVVFGMNVPIAPYNSLALCEEQLSGQVRLKIKIDGRIRWKVGTIMSRRYHFYVDCPAFITFDNPNTNIVGVKYQLEQKCSVSIS